MANQRTPLLGSEPVHPDGARRHHPLSEEHPLQVTVVLRPGADLAAPVWKTRPADRPSLGREALADALDPGEEAFERVCDFAAIHGLEVVETSRARHDVVLAGSPSALASAFGVSLHAYEHDAGDYYGHDEAVHLPPALAEIVVTILGLDSIPRHRPLGAAGPDVARLSPPQIAAHYGFPDVDAGHLRIALLQFGGGFQMDDLRAHATAFGYALPPVTVIPVPGARGESRGNEPLPMDVLGRVARQWAEGTSFLALMKEYRDAGVSGLDVMTTLEVTMDVQLAASLGGGAAIDVYVAPPGADGWRRGIFAALGLADLGGAEHPGVPAVISASWGSDEASFKPGDLQAIHSAISSATAMGVAFCCASGDRGAVNSFTESDAVNVNFPASSPAALACGGTRLAFDEEGRPSETAWKGRMMDFPMASGGGVSAFFETPSYQAGVDTPAPLPTTPPKGTERVGSGRWLPDVAASAGFEGGVHVILGGQSLAGGGTSAATPIWAALLARVSARVGYPLGGLASWLYGLGDACPIVDVRGEDNSIGANCPCYRAGKGWDPCTGLGAPDGAALVDALRSAAPKGGDRR